MTRTAASLGIPVPNETFIDLRRPPYVHNEQAALVSVLSSDSVTYPAFIKPLRGDSSLGITTKSLVQNVDDAVKYIKTLSNQSIYEIIVQEYLEGDEYGVGATGNIDYEAGDHRLGLNFYPILRVDFSKILSQNLPPILGFESKWEPDSPYWTDLKYVNAESTLSAAEKATLEGHCATLWDRFGFRDYGRFDWRRDKNGVLKLLEVNPNPGWCWDGKLAYMAGLTGRSYAQMLQDIFAAAHARLVKAGLDTTAPWSMSMNTLSTSSLLTQR